MGKHSDFRISSFRVVDAWRILQFNRKTEKYIKEFIWFGGTLSQNYRVNGLMRLGTLNKFELWFVQNVGILVSQLEAASEEFNSKKLMEEIKRTNTVNKGLCKNACYPLASEQALYFEWWTKLAAREHASSSLASSLVCRSPVTSHDISLMESVLEG